MDWAQIAHLTTRVTWHTPRTFCNFPEAHPTRPTSPFCEIGFKTNFCEDSWWGVPIRLSRPQDELGRGDGHLARVLADFLDDSLGYNLHGDFMNGRYTEIVKKAVVECNGIGGVVETCGALEFLDDAVSGSL